LLHELYHHLVKIKRLELPERVEEKEANTMQASLSRNLDKNAFTAETAHN